MAHIFETLINNYPEDYLLKTLSAKNTSYISNDTYNKISNFLWNYPHTVISLEDLNALALLIENNYEIIIYDKTLDVLQSDIIIAASVCKNMQFLKKLLEKDINELFLICGYIIHGIEFSNELIEGNYVTTTDIHIFMAYACDHMDIQLIENLMNLGEDIMFIGIIRLITLKSTNMVIFTKLCSNCDLHTPDRYDRLVKIASYSEIHFKYLVSIGIDLLRTDILNTACNNEREAVIDYLLFNGVQPNKETLTFIVNNLRSSIVHIFRKYSIDFSHINQETERNKISLLTDLGIDHEFVLETLLTHPYKR